MTDTSGPSRWLTREQIAERLEILSKSPPPERLGAGAMCYVMEPNGSVYEYVCPVCGNRTVSATGGLRTDRAYVLEKDDVTIFRWLVEKIRSFEPSLDISIDESSYCRLCHPEVISPRLDLVIRYPGGGNVRRVEGVTLSDLGIVKDFLSGLRVHKSVQGDEIPLCAYIDRLREMLGAGPD
jgi:hypothetical protein